MRKSIKILIFTLIVTVLASALCIVAYASSSLMVDFDNVFTTNEIAELEDRLTDVSSEYNCEIAIVTVPSFNGKEPDVYAESYYDRHGYGYGSDSAGALFIFSESERQYAIVLNGKVNDAFTNSKFNKLLDSVEDKLRENAFYAGACAYIDIVEERLENYESSGGKRGMDTDKLATGIIISVIIAIIVGVVAVLIMRSKMNNAKPQKGAAYYEKKNSFLLDINHDAYLYSTVTRRLKPQNNSSSRGRSGGSRRSGGRF